MRKGRSRGNIATVLLVAVVCLGLVMTIAGLATSQLAYSNHLSNSIRARNAADSAIQTALAHLLDDPSFGSAPETMPVAGLIEQRSGDTLGRLAFDAAQAEELGLPPSRNNVDSDAPVEGWKGRVVPCEAVQLVAVGECCGVRRTIETIVHLPRFPYVICTSGRFESQGPLLLGVIPETAEADWVAPEDLLPGHLASNSNAGDAVRLLGAAVISGDVEAVGGIEANPPVVIRGSRLTDSDPVDIPALALADYDPGGRPGTEVFTGSTEDVTLAGYNRSPGPAVTVNGDLRLEAGVLYVAGDLTVNGDVKGRGAIFTEGQLTVTGCAEMEPDQQIALVAHGNVTLGGSGRFRGVVYTEGDFTADGVALVGSFIGNSPSGGTMRIIDAGIVAGDPQMSFEENWLCSQTTTQGLWWGGPDVWGPYGERNPDFYPLDFPTWRQTSRFVGMEDGLVVVEWQIEGFFPDADQEAPTVYPRREYYTPEGELARVSFEGPGGIAGDPATRIDIPSASVPGAESWTSNFYQDGVLTGNLTISKHDQPGYAKPERVQVYQEVADFRLDFSQFFSMEDKIQTVLWMEH